MVLPKMLKKVSDGASRQWDFFGETSSIGSSASSRRCPPSIRVSAYMSALRRMTDSALLRKLQSAWLRRCRRRDSWVKFCSEMLKTRTWPRSELYLLKVGATVAVNITICDIGNTLGWVREGPGSRQPWIADRCCRWT